MGLGLEGQSEESAFYINWQGELVEGFKQSRAVMSLPSAAWRWMVGPGWKLGGRPGRRLVPSSDREMVRWPGVSVLLGRRSHEVLRR